MSPTNDDRPDEAGEDGIVNLLDVLDRMFPQIGDEVTVYPGLPLGGITGFSGLFGGVMLTEDGVPSCIRLDESGVVWTIPWPCSISRDAKP